MQDEQVRETTSEVLLDERYSHRYWRPFAQTGWQAKELPSQSIAPNLAFDDSSWALANPGDYPAPLDFQGLGSVDFLPGSRERPKHCHPQMPLESPKGEDEASLRSGCHDSLGNDPKAMA